jgi:hypothetical protein
MGTMPLKNPDKVAGQTPARIQVPGRQGELAAAGLLLRIVGPHPQPGENLHHRLPDVGKNLVDEAGDKEAYRLVRVIHAKNRHGS